MPLRFRKQIRLRLLRLYVWVADHVVGHRGRPVELEQPEPTLDCEPGRPVLLDPPAPSPAPVMTAQGTLVLLPAVAAESRLRGPLEGVEFPVETYHLAFQVFDVVLLFGDEGVGMGQLGSEFFEGFGGSGGGVAHRGLLPVWLVDGSGRALGRRAARLDGGDERSELGLAAREGPGARLSPATNRRKENPSHPATVDPFVVDRGVIA